MARQLTIKPARLDRTLTRSDGVTGVQVNVGEPKAVRLNGSTLPSAHLICAFTPSATTITINFNGADTLAISGGTARISSAVGAGIANDTPFHVRLWARRKPGTTGAIVAQTITLKGGSSGANTLGSIRVAAAAAGADPVCDFLDLPCVASGNTNHTFDSTDKVTITVTAADTDLEIVYEAYGTAE